MHGTGRNGKPRNKPPELKGKTQKERFIETAKALEADESGNAFEKALEAITIPSAQFVNKDRLSSKNQK